MMATAAHFAVFKFFPVLTAADLSFGVTEFEAVELPPEVEIPPPPEQVQRPAVPIVAQADLDEDMTIAPTTFEENPVDQLPAPPTDAARLGDRPVFTPYTVGPVLKDPAGAAEIVREAFPLSLRSAGIGGKVEVWAFIDENGSVEKCQVEESSGYDGLDRAAIQAVMQFSFRPALNYDRKVAVWVRLPIVFQVEV